MEMTLRWYGTGFDSVTLQQIRQVPGRHYAESVPGSVFYDHTGYGHRRSGIGDTFGKSGACYGGIYTFVQTGK